MGGRQGRRFVGQLPKGTANGERGRARCGGAGLDRRGGAVGVLDGDFLVVARGRSSRPGRRRAQGAQDDVYLPGSPELPQRNRAAVQ
ncbi:hypothetical protein ACFFX0_29080 [Citricoccus parietis]|uniref:Uncharacterized protein n=1 Tax=Citricoccus parietis TaxID=592307 RepID=A0ABV5G8S7_9MICC